MSGIVLLDLSEALILWIQTFLFRKWRCNPFKTSKKVFNKLIRFLNKYIYIYIYSKTTFAKTYYIFWTCFWNSFKARGNLKRVKGFPRLAISRASQNEFVSGYCKLIAKCAWQMCEFQNSQTYGNNTRKQSSKHN